MFIGVREGSEVNGRAITLPLLSHLNTLLEKVESLTTPLVPVEMLLTSPGMQHRPPPPTVFFTYPQKVAAYP